MTHFKLYKLSNNKKGTIEDNNIFKSNKYEISMKTKSFVFLIFGLMLISGFIAADMGIQPGGPPKSFSGSVYVNGNLLNNGGTYIVTAEINHLTVAQATLQKGHYSNLYVSTGSPDFYGTITFFVNDVQATETSSWNNLETEFGENVSLDLNLSSYPTVGGYCGDGEINGAEQCDISLGYATCNLVMSLYYGESGYSGTLGCTSSCTYNTSSCVAPVQTTPSTSSPSSGSGGGGGGGSYTPSTTGNVVSSGNSSTSSNESSTAGINESSTDIPSNKRGITGFATFTGSAVGKGLIVLIVLGILALGFFYTRGRLKNKKKD